MNNSGEIGSSSFNDGLYVSVLVVFACLYLDPAIHVFGFLVPGVLGLVVIGIAGKYWSGVFSYLYFFILFFLFSLLAVFSSSASPVLSKIVSSFGQISYALFLAFVLYGFLFGLNKSRLSISIRWLFVLCYGLFFLDYVGVITHISERVSESLYSGDVGFEFYGASEYSLIRDIELAGGRRPSVFSPEPSIAVLGLTVVSALLFITNTSSKILMFSVSCLAGVWYVYKSPIPLGGMVLIVVYAYYVYGNEFKLRFAAFSIVLFPVLVYLVWQRFEKLSYDIEIVATSSEGIRLMLPFENAFGVFFNGDFFGAGPGANSDYKYVAGLNKFWSPVFGTNAVAQLFFYYGFILAPLLLFFYWVLLKNQWGVRIGWGFALLAYLFLGFSLGAMESIRLMGFWVLLVGCASKFLNVDKNE